MKPEQAGALREQGLTRFEAVLREDTLAELRGAVDELLAEDRAAGRSLGSHTYLLHARHPALLALVEQSPLQDEVDALLGPHCLLHSYGALRVDPGSAGLVQQGLHRDTPRFTGDLRLGVQLLYLLDPSTEDNGGFHAVAGSHRSAEPPGAGAREQLVEGRAGDVLLFDVHLWHRSGRNGSGSPRRALTQTFTRPFMKQQIDLPAATPPELASGLSLRARRLLGFDARVPRSLDEFDRPPAERFYKPGQG